MPLSDPLDILLAHDHWATTQLLTACRPLTPEQFHRRFEIGFGSLHDTITHILAAMRALGDTLAARPDRPRLDDAPPPRTPDDLLALLNESAQTLAAEARRLPLTETITRKTRTGQTLQMTRGATLTHLATHAVHHRAQCLNILRHLVVTPLPPSSVAEWTWLADRQH